MFFKKKPEVTEIQTIQTLTYITIAPNGVKCFLMLNDLFGGRYAAPDITSTPWTDSVQQRVELTAR